MEVKQQYKRKKWALWAFIVLLSALLLTNLAGDYFVNMFNGFLTALTPLILGLSLAFLLKKLVTIFEQNVIKNWFKKCKNPEKARRIFTLILFFSLLVLLIVFLMWVIIPPMASFIKDMYDNGSIYIQRIQTQLTNFFSQFSWFAETDVNQIITNFIKEFGATLTKFAPVILESALGLISQTALFVGFVIIGIVIAFLFLKDREKINFYARRATYISLERKKADFVCGVFNKGNNVLYDYFAGKILEALVVFSLMLPGFLLLKVPYAVEMSILIALLNFIPYLGSIVAMIIIALVTFIKANVADALWSFIYINVILIIIGNFISPFIFGKKLKISALEVLVGVLIGGGLFGFWGMLFGPPAVAIISLVYNEWLNTREKELEIEVPPTPLPVEKQKRTLKK